MNLEAYTRHDKVKIAGNPEGGPLAGTIFAAKDLFDVAGRRTGAGNPTWLQTHNMALKTAPAIEKLVHAGATLLGKTQTVELAFGMTGHNIHYGMPLNPAAPERIPGGSSSGSASAVAGRACDFALGTDTGGSVRVPASYCGIFGMRPTHGRISVEGVVPLCPSFDTVGWFAREAVLLERVGRVLLDETDPAPEPNRLLVAVDAQRLSDPDVHKAILPWIGRARSFFEYVYDTEIGGALLPEWSDAYRILAGAEAWATHGEWIEETKPKLGPDVMARFMAGKSFGPEQIAKAKTVQQAAIARLGELLLPGTILCLPTAPVPPPLREAEDATFERVRQRTMQLTCPAGLAGLPQINVPAGFAGDAPVGVSFVAARGSDAMLLNFVRLLTSADEDTQNGQGQTA
ncbi:MAG: amidase [Azospirillum sp.]|nr:amidase [Azospirillum sp.]